MTNNYRTFLLSFLATSFVFSQSIGLSYASTDKTKENKSGISQIGQATAQTVSSHATSDIQDSYAKSAIEALLQAGIFTTSQNGRFRPNDPMNREELAVVLARALNLNTNDSTKRFQDVDNWAIPYVNAVVDAQIEPGLNTTTFGAHQSVTREQFITSIIKGLGFDQDVQTCDFGSTFQDRATISDQGQPYIGFAQRIGLLDWLQWTKSANSNTFLPKQNIERQDVAFVIDKMIQSRDDLTANAESLLKQSQSPVSITQVDLESWQGEGYHHPEQVSLERSFKTSNLLTEIYQIMPTPDSHPFSIAKTGDNQFLFIGDSQDGVVYKSKKDDASLVSTVVPQDKPNNDIRGLAVDDQQDLYLYYDGGTIQQIDQTGKVLQQFTVPTKDGQSLIYQGGKLNILDSNGHVFEIDPKTKKTLEKFELHTPDGGSFTNNSTYALAWDGKHYLVSNAQDNWNLYEYDDQFHFLRTITSDQRNITGLVYDGSHFEMLNSNSNTLVTFRITDDTSYDIGGDTTDHYQYINTLFTTPAVEHEFPVYSDHNAFLVYNDSMVQSNDTLKPYVSFLDKQGNRIGTMFDTFVYLPSPALNNYKFTNESEFTLWISYLDKTMNDLQTLDNEWGKRNKDLKKQDPANIYIAVPYPSKDFNLETRESLIDSYIDNAIDKFQKSNFSNLKLKGFYWYREYADRGEPIVVHFNQYVHNKGLLTMWIPAHSYNKGNGYLELDVTNDHNQLGFDEVYEQPNYFFDEPLGSQNPNRFFSIALSGPIYQKAFEMEMSTYLLGDKTGAHKQYFYDYLHYGDLFGFLYGSKAWYDEGQIGKAFKQDYNLYSTMHDVVEDTYHDPSIKDQQPVDGSIVTTNPISLPIDTKLRFDISAKSPFNIKTITIHTNDTLHHKAEFTGTIRSDEELVLRHETLVKQDIGQSPDGLRIGFDVPINTPVHVVVLPQNS